MFDLEEVLVPIDFSATSRAAFDRAVRMVSGTSPVVILHHVLDPALAEFAEAQGLGEQVDF